MTALEQAAELGREHGFNAGSWMIDGNTTEETARRLLQGIEDGDPEVMEMAPNPLSGEWADSLTPRSLMAAVGIEDAYTDGIAEDVCETYETAYAAAFWSKVERAAKAVLGLSS